MDEPAEPVRRFLLRRARARRRASAHRGTARSRIPLRGRRGELERGRVLDDGDAHAGPAARRRDAARRRPRRHAPRESRRCRYPATSRACRSPRDLRPPARRRRTPPHRRGRRAADDDRGRARRTDTLRPNQRMTTADITAPNPVVRTLEGLIFGARRLILALFAALTVFMGYVAATGLHIDAGF